MQVSEKKVVSFNYTLTDKNGAVLDSSENRDPLSYIQGMGHIISGLEEKMEGKKSGDKFNVTIQPEKAYGTRKDELVIQVDRSQFPNDADLQKGMQFQSDSPQGTQVFTIVKVLGDTIMLDGNHPLAGEVLNFDVEVVGVRDATAEELNHGHVHGPGGHHH